MLKALKSRLPQALFMAPDGFADEANVRATAGAAADKDGDPTIGAMTMVGLVRGGFVYTERFIPAPRLRRVRAPARSGWQIERRP